MKTSAASAVRSRLAHGAQPRRSGFLAGLQQQLHVEAQPAARGQDLAQRRDVDAVLALVVRGAAPVPAIAVHGQRPRRETRAPLRVVPQHDVAVAVHEDRRAARRLRAARQAGTGRARDRILDDAKREAQRGKRGADFVREVAAQIGKRIAALALRAMGDPPRARASSRWPSSNHRFRGRYGVLPGRHARDVTATGVLASATAANRYALDYIDAAIPVISRRCFRSSSSW